MLFPDQPLTARLALLSPADREEGELSSDGEPTAKKPSVTKSVCISLAFLAPKNTLFLLKCIILKIQEAKQSPADLSKKIKQLSISTLCKRARNKSEDSGYDSLDEVFKRQKRKSSYLSPPISLFVLQSKQMRSQCHRSTKNFNSERLNKCESKNKPLNSNSRLRSNSTFKNQKFLSSKNRTPTHSHHKGEIFASSF